jgi:hypothetical protein
MDGGLTYEKWFAAPRPEAWLGVRWSRLANGKVKRETLRVVSDDCWEAQAAIGRTLPPVDAVAVLHDHPILLLSGRCLDGCCDITGKTRRAEVEATLHA